MRIWFIFSLFIASAWLPGRVVAAVGPGWLAGPGATADNTSYAGVIDAPLNETRITKTGTLQLAGWFVDRTATGWAGADDIEIFAGTMGNGGSLLTHTLFAEERPDVAAAFERPDCQGGRCLVVAAGGARGGSCPEWDTCAPPADSRD